MKYLVVLESVPTFGADAVFPAAALGLVRMDRPESASGS